MFAAPFAVMAVADCGPHTVVPSIVRVDPGKRFATVADVVSCAYPPITNIMLPPGMAYDHSLPGLGLPIGTTFRTPGLLCPVYERKRAG